MRDSPVVGGGRIHYASILQTQSICDYSVQTTNEICSRYTQTPILIYTRPITELIITGGKHLFQCLDYKEHKSRHNMYELHFVKCDASLGTLVIFPHCFPFFFC